MINIAILGYGVVGSGVAEVIRKSAASIKEKTGEVIQVKKILDIRSFPESPDKGFLTSSEAEIFEDDSIGIVVETIGGAGVAYEFTKRALLLGKHVVTSNKELVAKHGPELLKMARDHGVNYLFEASVGGGIPIIRPLHQCLAANKIHEITGILNGTTNYILTQMKKTSKDFVQALKEAQQNGYAEADPTADIEGYDACRKIAILSSIAYNEFVNYKSIHTEGISRITLADMKYAEAMNSTIKLIARSWKVGDKIYARVSPVIISNSNLLAGVEDVFNAIMVKGDAVGETMFYGRGAGKLPTASAVVADIIDIVKCGSCSGSRTWAVKEDGILPDPFETETRVFIRLKITKEDITKKLVNDIFGMVEWVEACGLDAKAELAFVSCKKPENLLKRNIKELREQSEDINVLNVIRVMDEDK